VHPAHVQAQLMQFFGMRVGSGARQSDLLIKIGDEDCQKNPIKTTFRPTITCSSQEGDAKQPWSPESSFLGRASRVTVKRKKHFGGIFPKKLDLSPFRVFSLLRSNVLLKLRYIYYTFEVFIRF